MYVYMWLMCACTVQAAITSSSFKHVHVLDVTLPDYDCYVLAVEHNLYNRIECSSKCGTGCNSYIYNQNTKECTTYTIEFCNDESVIQSSIIQIYVKRHISNCAPVSCDDLCPSSPSGVYRLTLIPNRGYNVYCDMDTAGGPWIVIQNRLDGEVGFHRNWTEYQDGFGDLQGSFWAGLDIIRALTQTGSILRIEMVTVTGAATYAQYSYFSVGDESSQYRLSIWGYSGNARLDAMSYHNGQRFTVMGRDNDRNSNYNCAERFHGGWWYNSCYQCHLNGPYVPLPNNRDGYMTWGRGRARIMKTRMLVK